MQVAVQPVLEKFVTAKETAEFLNVHVRTVVRLAREGRIPAHPITAGAGRRVHWRFLLSEVRAAVVGNHVGIVVTSASHASVSSR